MPPPRTRPSLRPSGLTARAVRPVLEGLKALGADVSALLREAAMEPLPADLDARVPHASMMALWDAAARRDDAVGLHVAEAAPLSAFDVHAYAVLSSPTLGDAYRRASRYQRLVHDATELTLDEGDPAVLRHALPGGRPVARQAAEFLLAVYVRLGRVAAGWDWSPVEVRFAHAAPGNAAEVGRFFASPVRFDAGENAILLSRALLDTPSARADPALLAILDRYAAHLLAKRPEDASTSGRVRAHLREALADGDSSSVGAARALGTSVRTLGRRLAAEGTSFGDVLDRLRRERALALLADDRNGVAEVAFLLGFAELSSFYRAFRRWTGSAPAAYRKRGDGARRQGP